MFLRWLLEITVLVEKPIPDPDCYGGTAQSEEDEELGEIQLKGQAVSEYSDDVSGPQDSLVSQLICWHGMGLRRQSDRHKRYKHPHPPQQV